MPITNLAANIGSNWESIEPGLSADSYYAAAAQYYPCGTVDLPAGVNCSFGTVRPLPPPPPPPAPQPVMTPSTFTAFCASLGGDVHCTPGNQAWLPHEPHIVACDADCARAAPATPAPSAPPACPGFSAFEGGRTYPGSSVDQYYNYCVSNTNSVDTTVTINNTLTLGHMAGRNL